MLENRKYTNRLKDKKTGEVFYIYDDQAVHTEQLERIATTGSYNDLKDTPNIQEEINSQLELQLQNYADKQFVQSAVNTAVSELDQGMGNLANTVSNVGNNYQSLSGRVSSIEAALQTLGLPALPTSEDGTFYLVGRVVNGVPSEFFWSKVAPVEPSQEEETNTRLIGMLVRYTNGETTNTIRAVDDNGDVIARIGFSVNN